jgi:hypothetical protein
LGSAFAGDDKSDPDLVLYKYLFDVIDSGHTLSRGASTGDKQTRPAQSEAEKQEDMGKVKAIEPNVQWPSSDEQAPDYAHLKAFDEPDVSFDLDHDVLDFLRLRNSFALRSVETKVLFGLRGCVFADATQLEVGFAKRISLRQARPNHRDPNCIIGVWDRDNATVSAYSGSTVPEAHSIALFAVNEADRCNLLLTGIYKFGVGLHVGKSGSLQPGSFVEKSSKAVLRTGSVPIYDRTDPKILMAVDRPGDNLHSAYPPLGKKPPPKRFFSAGCQTVVGGYNGLEPVGPWAALRKAAGLSDPPSKSDKQVFSYVLLTGKEALLAATKNAEFKSAYSRLRFGSSGAQVIQLQQGLRMAETGTIDGGTFNALVAEQRLNGAPLGIAESIPA